MTLMKTGVRSVLLAGGWMVLSLSSLAMAATYKWVDDKGIVHYSDKIPQDAVNKGSVQLDKQGRTIKKTEPMPTVDQVQAKEVDAAKAREQAKRDDEQRRRDSALTNSYTTEDEIDIARNRALGTVDASIKAAQTYYADLFKRKQQLESDKQKAPNKALPIVAERELAGIDAELAKQNELIEARQKEAAALTAKYDADKLRWRELKVAEAAATANTAGGKPAMVSPAASSGGYAPLPKGVSSSKGGNPGTVIR